MMKPNIPEGIGELSEGLERLRAHLAWLSLKELERKPGSPPVLLMDPDLVAAIRNDTSHFLATALKIREALTRVEDEKDTKRRSQWTREIDRLEREFHRLNLPKSL